MKKILLILTIAFMPLAISAQEANHWADEGNEMYRQGNYDEAVGYYEQAIGSGYASADLYYNLGNAYYRTNQMGAAILNYERALRLNPAMSDAKENLALANSRTVDRIAVLPQLLLVRCIDTLCKALSPHGWRLLIVILMVTLAAAIVTFRLGGSLSLRKSGLVVGIVTIVLLLLAVWLTLRATVHFNAHGEAIVMSQSLSVKGSPEAQSIDKLILHEGTKVTVNDSLAGWYKITIADGTTGWCSTGDIERI